MEALFRRERRGSSFPGAIGHRQRPGRRERTGVGYLYCFTAGRSAAEDDVVRRLSPGRSSAFVRQFRKRFWDLTSPMISCAWGDAQGLGVKQTQFAVDSQPFSLFTSSFNTPAEGAHTVSWFSRDVAGNVELVQSAAVLVDNTPPQTNLQLLGGRQFPGTDAFSVYASSDARIAFAAGDPVVSGVSAGVGLTLYRDNQRGFSGLRLHHQPA